MQSLPFAAVLVAVFTAGCWGDNSQLGVGEPFRVRNALGQSQFVPGKLPGETVVLDGAVADGPETTLRAGGGQFFPGQGDGRFDGDATTDTVAIGMALDDVGTGYWVVPVGDPILDPNRPRVGWNVSADFGRDIPPGRRLVRAVAIDKHGNAGPQATARVCIKGLVTDNLQSCSDSRHPPPAVITLNWDVNSDVDLQVVDPEGFVYEPKRPSSKKEGDAGAEVPLPAKFDHDSTAGCVPDGYRVENLAWTVDQPGPVGRYRIFANLFDACKQPAVRFAVSVFQAEGGQEDGGVPHLEQKFTAKGELLDIQANGGAQRGLFITEFVFR